MTIDDHHQLVVQLLELKGMCILSGYRSEVYLPLESAGWKLVEIETVASTSKNRTSRTECLWISPNSLNRSVLLSAPDIENDESLTNRQKAAFRVHRQRKDQSETAIREAIYSLKRMKKKVTKVAVARMTGISREHITRYYSELF
jgi:DNA adenine methylase